MDAGRLHVRLLGPFEVLVDGDPVGPAGERRRGLLSLLALEANAVVPVETLVDRMWGESPPASAVNVVQTYVSAWRKVLDVDGRTSRGSRRLHTVGAGYRLELAPEECDVLVFRDLLAQARAAVDGDDHGTAAALLGRALGLWRGPALADLSRQPFHDALTRELEAARLAALEGRAAAALRSGGDPAEVSASLAEAAAREPLRESLAELLMWSLTGSGRQAAALEVFHRMRERLRDELGADPGPALAAMHERVLANDATLQPSPGPPVQRVQTRQAPVNSFLGRSADLTRAADALRDHRLVTLTGPGGAGKSRLASEVLARELDGGGSGWFVELGPLRDADLVPATIAVALDLHVSAGADPVASLLTGLGSSTGLLVLDNLEHLAGVHVLVDRLHRSARELRILVTSREPLRIEGEQQLPVLPLLVPPDEVAPDVDALRAVDAVRLLMDRAREHDPSLVLDESNAKEIAEITRRLDGLPLALEIAAPWLRLLSPADLLTRLREPLDVAGRRIDAPERHRSLRETIRWSYQLLPPVDQALLRSLAVFAGSFTVDAAEAVCGSASAATAVDSLFDLVDRNLVQPVDVPGSQRRFRLLETIRAFAVEEAAHEPEPDATALALAHADWYARWSVQLAAHSEGPTSGEWLSAAVAEADNIRAALATYRRLGRTDDWLQLVVDAMTLWFEAGHEAEGEAYLASALDAAGDGAPARAIALTYWAWLRGTHHRDEAAAAAREAVALARRAGDPLVEAFGLQTLGDTTDDPDEAEDASRAVFDAADRSTGLPVRYGPTAPDAVRCGASYNLAARLLHRSLPEAMSWQQEALRLAELEGDRRITAVNAARLAHVHLLADQPVPAGALLRRARELVSTRVIARWEDIVGYAEALHAMHEGRTDDAERLLHQVLRSSASAGRPLHVNLAAASLADLHTSGGRTAAAAAALAEADRHSGPATDRLPVARLAVRRARLLRLDGAAEAAATELTAAAGAMDTTALPPERVVWLLESAALEAVAGRPAGAAVHLGVLDDAVRATGVRLPPWERAWRRQVEGGPTASR
jgi:predicted ATPase/DNA-binding SARP family transcriptional activator